MVRKNCFTLTKELKNYLHEQEHEMARLLKTEPDIKSNSSEASHRLIQSDNLKTKQRTRIHNTREDSSTDVAVSTGELVEPQKKRSCMLNSVCIGLAIPLILLIILLLGTICGVTGHGFPWFYEPKIYY